MTEIEWHDEMKRTLAPHMDSLRQDLQQRWPSLDPELAMLHWLCMKHNLEPPAVKLRRQQGALPSSPPSSAPHSPSSPSSPLTASSARGPKRPFSTFKACVCGSILPKEDAFCGKCGAGTSTDLLKTRKPGSLEPLSPVSPQSPLSPLSPVRPPSGGQSRGLEAATWPDPAIPFQPQPPQTPKPTGLRSLAPLNMQIEHDARKHNVNADFMEANKVSMVDMVADMRLQVRGQFLGKLPILSRNILSEAEQFRLVGKLKPQNFAGGHKIIAEGEFGDKLFIIERGSCEVMKLIKGREHVVGQLSKGAFFGEIATLYDMPRTATVTATSEVTALSLSREDLQQSIGDDKIERMRVIARTQVFNSIALLKNCHPDQKVRIAQAMKQQTWRKGSLLAGEMHITSRLFVVERGHISMEARSQDLLPSFWPKGEKTIDMGPGAFFCMRGLLYGAQVGFNFWVQSEYVSTLSISMDEILDTALPSEREDMMENMRHSMQAYLLRGIPQLKLMADEFFDVVRRRAEEVHYKKWSVIASKGQDIDCVYILEKGMVMEHDGEALDMMALPGEEASWPGDSTTHPKVTPGELFGVHCLIDKHARSKHTLVALTDVTLLRLPQSAVWTVLHEERQHISRIPLLSQIGKAEQYMLVGKLHPWKFSAGHCIVKEGEVGDMLYIIERGTCDAIKVIDGKETVLGQLKKSDFFGELAVMYDMPRTATVRATTDVLAVSLSREDIFSTVGSDQFEYMRSIAITQVFNQIPLLASLDAATKVKVAQCLRTSTYEPGAIVHREGEPIVRLHIIERGEVKLEKGGQPAMRQRGAGETIGELGLLHSEKARFTISASTEVKTQSITLNEILDTAGAGERPALERKLQNCFRIALLRKVPQLSSKSLDIIQAALHHAESVSYEAGDTIFEELSELDAAYILERGEVLATGSKAEQMGKTERAGRDAPRHFGAECLLKGGVGARAGYTLQATSSVVMLRVPVSVAQLMLK